MKLWVSAVGLLLGWALIACGQLFFGIAAFLPVLLILRKRPAKEVTGAMFAMPALLILPAHLILLIVIPATLQEWNLSFEGYPATTLGLIGLCGFGFLFGKKLGPFGRLFYSVMALITTVWWFGGLGLILCGLTVVPTLFRYFSKRQAWLELFPIAAALTVIVPFLVKAGVDVQETLGLIPIYIRMTAVADWPWTEMVLVAGLICASISFSASRRWDEYQMNIAMALSPAILMAFTWRLSFLLPVVTLVMLPTLIRIMRHLFPLQSGAKSAPPRSKADQLLR